MTVLELGIEWWLRSAEQAAAARPVWSFKLPTQNNEFRQLPVSEEIRNILRYDEAAAATWRDAAGRTWQLYYLRWLPARNWYRAAETVRQARGHSPDVCLRNVGMILQTNLGTRIPDINGARMKVTTERFLASGRTVHVLSVYWEPDEVVLQSAEKVRERGEIGTSSPRTVVWRVAHALRIRDRGANEKRVLKIAAWDMETDEAAQSVFHELLTTIVQK